MKSYRTNTLLLACLALAGLACGDEARQRDTSADTVAADSADVAPDTSVDTTVETTPDTTAPDTLADTTPADTMDTNSAEAEVTPATCSPDDLAACEYPSRELEYAVREGLTTTDLATGRSLKLLARIPAVAGPVPVVIWSHGGGFNPVGERSSEQWGDLLARHGYLVIHIAHALLTTETGRAGCALASVPEAECVPGDDEDANGLLAVFRAYDIAAVLDDLPRLSQLSVANGGPALDLDKVALSGWSGGSRGPMVLMGATVRPTPGAPLFSKTHARPAAAFIMSPTGPGFGGFYDDETGTSWDAMRGPFMMATGTNDVKPLKPGLDGSVRRAPFAAQPGDGKRVLLYSNLAVGVGGHATYDLEDIGSNDERLDRLTRALGSSVRAFLDASLRNSAAALAWLATDQAKVLAGEADWLRR